MRIGFFVVFLAGLSALAAVPANSEVPDSLQTSPLAELFGSPPTFGSPRLSPDGNQMIFLQQNEEGVRVLRSLDFTTSEMVTIWPGLVDDFEVEWCEWANDTRLLCEFRTLRQDQQRTVPLVEYYSMNARGAEAHSLKICGRAIDWLPEDPENVLVVCDGRGSGRAQRVNIFARGFVNYGHTRPNSDTLVSDGHGMVRLARQKMDTERWYVQNHPDDRWEQFFRSRWQRFDDPFRPVGFGENLDEVLHIGWNSGTWALFAKNLAVDFQDRLIFADSKVDVEQIDKLGAYDRAVAVTYLDGSPQQFVFDERIAAVQQIVSASLPGREIEILDESWDRHFYLVRARAPNRAGELFRVDAIDESLELIGPEYDHLADTILATTRTIVFEGYDGGRITGHLTLPTGGELPAPVVIIPRAAPSRLDVLDPHYLVQFLAANGYAVLRVNQRGPADYGDNWSLEKVVVGFERAAQDLQAATDFLIEQGIAARGNVCGAGRDVAAYAVLMTAISLPQMFECIVSIGGYTDPRAFGVSMPRSIYTMLEEASPVQRAKELEPAVLLIDDRAAQQSESLEDALTRADKDVTFIEYFRARREFDQKPYRIDMLTRIDEFLARHLE